MKKKLKIGIVGLGNQGMKHLLSAQRLEREGEVIIVGVSDVNKPTFSVSAPYFKDYIQLYDIGKPDIVVIATPNFLHKEMTIKALKKNIHVIKEKPLAITYEDALEMVQESKKMNRILATTQQRYYSPLYQKAKSLIKTLGTPCSFYYRFTLDDNINSWKWDIYKAGGGTWLNMGWHGISMIHWLMGEICTVNLSWKKGDKRTWSYSTDHSSLAKVKLNGNINGSLFLSCANPKEEKLKIIFSNGILYLKRKELHIFTENTEIIVKDKSDEENLYYWQLKKLIDKIRHNRYNPENDLNIMKVIQEGIDSASENNTNFLN